MIADACRRDGDSVLVGLDLGEDLVAVVDELVQHRAGEGSGITDADYQAQGATIVGDAEAAFGEADLIVKVKEPQPKEVARLEPRHILFTYLHLAPDPELTQGLLDSGATCIAYETVEHATVLVDVSIDQGGCFETSRATTHTDPTYEVDGITHYCVANMPGAVPITSTRALTNATLPYVVTLADGGPEAALADDPGFLAGLSVAAGKLTSAPVAEDQGLTYAPAAQVIAQLAQPVAA